MFFGDEFVEKVRERTDVVDLIGTHVSLKRAGSNYVGLCPFHHEKTPSFSVSPTKQIFYCFGCHKGGDVFTFLEEYENMTFSESVQALAERAGMPLPEGSDNPENRRRTSLREELFKVNSLAGQYYFACLRDPKGAEGMKYLQARGVSDEMLHRFALGFATQSGGLYRFLKSKGYTDDVLKQSGLFVYDEKRGPYDKFWNRVMFPIVDRRNHVIGFGGRVMGDGKPKYMNSPETMVFDKSKNLYGINYIHGKLPQGMILCEGYMDVIALHQAGFTQAVAALGTAFTPGHAALISRITEQVYLCFDGDGAGINAAMKAIPVLKNAGISAKVIDLSPHKDPDEFFKAHSVEDFEERMRKAKSSFFFEVDVTAREFDMDDPEQKTRFMNRIAARIIEFEDEVERSNYIEAFSREYGVRAEDFRALVIKQSARRVGMEEKVRSQERRAADRRPGGDAQLDSQGFVLSWLCDHPDRFSAIRGYVSVDDFVDEPYHTIASILYEQLEQSGRVNPPVVISRFPDPEEQSFVAGIFNTTLETGEDEEARAMQDVIRVLLQHSLDYRSSRATGIEEVQKCYEDKKRLEQMSIQI